jgi:hypothetical protein
LARGGQADDRPAMARRQIARAVTQAIGRENELDTLPVEEVIVIICRDLGLDPVRMTLRPPLPGVNSVAGMDEAGPIRCQTLV